MTRLNALTTTTFNLIISAFIIAMLFLANESVNFPLVLLSLAVPALLTKTGELTVRLSRLNSIKSRLPMTFTVGFVLISLPMVILTYWFKLPALTSLAITTTITFGLNLFTPQKNDKVPANDWIDVAATGLFAGGIGLLIKIPVSSPALLVHTGVLPIWSDYFLHGVTISSFGSQFANGSDMELVGAGRAFYHYASFMIPAAFQTISGLSGIVLATGLLLPLGLLIAALGSYVLAVELGGKNGGILAVAVIVCIPGYLLFIQSGWFNFNWLMLIAPGSGYAVGVSCAACAALFAYFDQKNIRFLYLSIFLLFSLVLIRVHMFILLAPALIATALVHHRLRRLRTLLMIAGGLVLVCMLTLHFAPNIHALWLQFCDPHQYLTNALDWSPIYGHKIELGEHPLFTIVAQLFFVLVAILGVYLVLYPSLLVLSIRRFGFQFSDALPIFLLASFIILILVAPRASNGDISEFKHRHFPLMYTIIAVYTIAYISRNLPGRYTFRYNQPAFIVALAIFSLTIFTYWNGNPAEPDIRSMPWAADAHGQKVAPGLIDATNYLKAHAEPGEAFAMDLESTETTMHFIVAEVISLTGLPAFISRPDLKATGAQCVQNLAKNRLVILRNLTIINNWSDAQIYLRENGIRWFLASSKVRPRWDSEKTNAVFSSGQINIYDAGLSTPHVFNRPLC